jgi:uncharacterized cupredoxin-like copper-binding protein
MTYFNNLNKYIDIDLIKNPLIILFIILLSLVLMSCLGVYKEGFVSAEKNSYYNNGSSSNTKKVYINGYEITAKKFTASNGNTAYVTYANDDIIIVVKNINGQVTKYTNNGTTSTTSTTNTTSTTSTTSTNTLYVTEQTIFYGQSGGTAKIAKGQNGNYVIEVTNSSGQIEYYVIQNTNNSTTAISSQTYTNYDNGASSVNKNVYINGYEITAKKFTASNGNTAVVVSSNGNILIVVTDINGQVTTYTNNNTSSTSSTTTVYVTEQTIFYGPSGGTAKIAKGQNGNYVIQVTNSSGQIVYYVIQNTSQEQMYPSSSTYANVQTTSQPYTYPYSQQYQENIYSSALPPGIPASQIPPGQEDLYILKSEVIPPVCPACPAPIMSTKSKTENCAACPPCGRCPQPNFECKKVPNYTSTNNDLPSAILPASYSTYGL